MAHAIRLYFDPELEATIAGITAAMARVVVAPPAEILDNRPHLSVAAAAELDIPYCASMLDRLTKAQRSFVAEFAAFGTFLGGQGVIYLSPTPSEFLLSIHRAVYRQLTDAGVRLHEHFLPEGWVPHVTVGFEPPGQEAASALSWLRANFKPLAGRFGSIGLVEYPPVEELDTFVFAG